MVPAGSGIDRSQIMADAAWAFHQNTQQIGLRFLILGCGFVLFLSSTEPTQHDDAVGASTTEHDLASGIEFVIKRQGADLVGVIGGCLVTKHDAADFSWLHHRRNKSVSGRNREMDGRRVGDTRPDWPNGSSPDRCQTTLTGRQSPGRQEKLSNGVPVFVGSRFPNDQRLRLADDVLPAKATPRFRGRSKK